MIVTCECGERYQFDEQNFLGTPVKRTDCPKCGRALVIRNPELFSTKIHQEVLDERLKRLESPKFTLSILQGITGGKVIPLDKPRFSIGRLGTDIEIDDPEASRVHAEILIDPNGVTLRDLNSSNGTFVKGKKIQEVVLSDDAEFRIGQTLFEIHKVLLTFD